MRWWLSMDKEKLNLIIRNIELLVDSLKAEVHSDDGVHDMSDEDEKEYFNRYGHPDDDYDEVFNSNDVYPD